MLLPTEREREGGASDSLSVVASEGGGSEALLRSLLLPLVLWEEEEEEEDVEDVEVDRCISWRPAPFCGLSPLDVPFLQLTQVQAGVHSMPALKHSQYFFKHIDLRHRHPSLWTTF